MYSCLRGENISWKGISYAVKLLFIGKDNRHTISYMDSESRLFINPSEKKKKKIEGVFQLPKDYQHKNS